MSYILQVYPQLCGHNRKCLHDARKHLLSNNSRVDRTFKARKVFKTIKSFPRTRSLSYHIPIETTFSFHLNKQQKFFFLRRWAMFIARLVDFSPRLSAFGWIIRVVGSGCRLFKQIFSQLWSRWQWTSTNAAQESRKWIFSGTIAVASFKPLRDICANKFCSHKHSQKNSN